MLENLQKWMQSEKNLNTFFSLPFKGSSWKVHVCYKLQVQWPCVCFLFFQICWWNDTYQQRVHVILSTEQWNSWDAHLISLPPLIVTMLLLSLIEYFNDKCCQFIDD